MQALRYTGMTEMFRTAYISQEELTAFSEMQLAIKAGKDEVDDQEAPSLINPFMQPMGATLYLDGAAGFGTWNIYISSRARGHLRSIYRKNRKVFTIVVEKIKLVPLLCIRFLVINF